MSEDWYLRIKLGTSDYPPLSFVPKTPCIFDIGDEVELLQIKGLGKMASKYIACGPFKVVDIGIAVSAWNLILDSKLQGGFVIQEDDLRLIKRKGN